MLNEKTTAAAATATDEVKQNDSSKYSCYLNNSTESGFCQAMLVQIIELADDIVTALGQADSVEAAQHAGMIKGLATALEKALLSGEDVK